MKTLVSILCTILAVLLNLSPAATRAAEKQVFVPSHRADLITYVVKMGGSVVREMKHLTVLRCDEALMRVLDLEEDIQVHAAAYSSNTQVRATLVHQAGNTGQGRKIVLLDSGVDYFHPELKSSHLGGYDFVNRDDDPMDDNGHGTFVAGLITADGIDANIRGIAPDAGIISAKVLDEVASGTLSNIVEAIYWAVDGPDGIYGSDDDFHADAINISLGTREPYVYTKSCDEVFPTLTQAIDYAVSRNVPVVVAAGNTGRAGVTSPGCITSALTVGAVDAGDAIASFSGQGKSVDLVAPGVQLLSCWLGGNYLTVSGTSASTPLVSGTIALMKRDRPDLGDADVMAALSETSVKLRPEKRYGSGRVDAFSAVHFKDNAPSASHRTAATDSRNGTGATTGSFPDPFNPITTIMYQLPSSAPVRLSVFNSLGQQVAVLVDETQNEGYHAVTFDAGSLPSGVYYYSLQTGSSAEMRRMVLLK